MDGKGIYTHADGRVLEGFFEKNMFKHQKIIRRPPPPTPKEKYFEAYNW